MILWLFKDTSWEACQSTDILISIDVKKTCLICANFLSMWNLLFHLEREKKKRERKINIALSLLQFWLWLVLEIQYSLLISCFPIYGLERGVLIKCEAGSIFIWNSFHFLEFIHNWSFQRNCEIPFLYLLVAFIFVA